MSRKNPTLENLQQRFETLTPAPKISSSLKELVAEGNINPDEIISLIRLEPLLATRIMREANQMVDARNTGYSSIEEAATAVGFKRMYDLLGIYAYQYCDSNDTQASYSTDHWKRAITCAVCMESLAAKHRLDPQMAYSIGLVHSLSTAIEESSLTSLEDQLVNENPYSELNTRLKSFGSVGLSYTLFRDWNFPDRFTDPIRFQYSPLDCKTTGKVACLLNLSKWITGVIRESEELPDQDYGPDVLVLNLLGEGEQTLWNLVSDVSESLMKADEVLQGNYTYQV
ncbi:HDOD domain-containing protein [Puniceicoccaceae bacterium K14]|nr:HDOD domain-containing protein [Puniceicoccaceae bacterium K14]